MFFLFLWPIDSIEQHQNYKFASSNVFWVNVRNLVPQSEMHQQRGFSHIEVPDMCVIASKPDAATSRPLNLLHYLYIRRLMAGEGSSQQTSRRLYDITWMHHKRIFMAMLFLLAFEVTADRIYRVWEPEEDLTQFTLDAGVGLRWSDYKRGFKKKC